jgi:hypothetical protein
VIVVWPTPTLVTTPELFTVATPVLELVHGVEAALPKPDKVMVPPTQIVEGPEIVGS